MRNVFVLFFTLANIGTAFAQANNLPIIQQSVAISQQICLVNNKVAIAIGIDGNITISKLLPSGKVEATYSKDEVVGGRFLSDAASQIIIDNATRDCMQAQWKSVYQTATGADTPPTAAKPSALKFSLADIVGHDGSNFASGRMLHPTISLVDNALANVPNTYNIEFNWTGSPGTQHGSQTAFFSFRSANGATIETVPVGIDRSGCYYNGGHPQVASGPLKNNMSLISDVSVSISNVEGPQSDC